MSDLNKLIFTELDNNRKVTPYRMRLQNTMLSYLERYFNDSDQQIRAAILSTLQQIQKKAKAASTAAPDAESRVHWANIYDKTGRILTWD